MVYVLFMDIKAWGESADAIFLETDFAALGTAQCGHYC